MGEDWDSGSEEVFLGGNARVITATKKAVQIECKDVFGFFV